MTSTCRLRSRSVGDFGARNEPHHLFDIRFRRSHTTDPPTGTQYHDAVGQVEHLGKVVADQQDRNAPLVDSPHYFNYGRRLAHPESGGRLVHDYDPPSEGGSSRHRNRLSLATG
jgi:hypothetical protein